MTKLLEIPGMIRDESNETYHKNPALSFSDLKKLMQSPELYKKHMDGLLPNEHKDVFDIGTAVHWATLEPDTLCEFYFADENYKGSTKEGKAIKADCEERGLTLMNAANSKVVKSCNQALQESDAINLFKEGEPEITWRVTSEKFNAQCRSDWICHNAPAGLESFGIEEGERYVADLKTTRSVDDWLSDLRWKNPLTGDLFYAGQETFYTQIIDTILHAADQGGVDKWLFVVVEKQEPFRVAVISTPRDVLSWAYTMVSNALDDFVTRKGSGEWTDERLIGAYEPEIYIR